MCVFMHRSSLCLCAFVPVISLSQSVDYEVYDWLKALSGQSLVTCLRLHDSDLNSMLD